MKRRFTRLPIASLAVVIGCFLVGLSLSPVDAQSVLTNGKVTVRSDGAVYLIANGMRRWVATVVISDEELNAYPEAEPIYLGLAPYGSSTGTTGSTTPAKSSITASKSTPTSKSSSSSSSSSDDDEDSGSSTSSSSDSKPDPTGKAKPTGDKTCPDSHQIKGGYDKYYWEPDRADYPGVEPEACFRTGKDARDNKYTDVKKR
jgi:hypothetical protein